MRMGYWICLLSCVVLVGALLGVAQPAAAQTQGDTGAIVVPAWRAVCRTPGFWGNRGSSEKDGWNYTQSVINAAGCLNVCGVDICGTDQPGLFGTLGSALEGLCVRNNDPTQLNQTFRQATAAALNCALSGATTPASCAALVNRVLVGITWEECNANCALGTDADEDYLNICYSQLNCANNGYKWHDGPDFTGCAMGACSLDGEYCGEDAGECYENVCDPRTDTCAISGGHCNEFTPCPVNECMSPYSCHDRGLCDSELWDDFGPPFTCDPEEKLGPASSPKLCRYLKRNTCTISNDSLSMLCGPGGCCEDNPCTGFCEDRR